MIYYFVKFNCTFLKNQVATKTRREEEMSEKMILILVNLFLFASVWVFVGVCLYKSYRKKQWVTIGTILSLMLIFSWLEIRKYIFYLTS